MAELSTFGVTSAPQAAPAETQQETVAAETTSQQTDIIAEAIKTSDSTPPQQEQPVTATEAQPAQAQDESSSQFAISLGEELDNAPASTQPASQPQFNWKDEIKKIDRSELFNELGIDPFALEIDRHIKGGGQPVDYLHAKAIDYNKISDDSLVKNELQKQFPTFTAQQIDLYFQKKYSVSEEADEDEKQFAELQLKADAHTLRSKLISEQQKFKIADTPVPQKDEAYEEWKQLAQFQAQSYEATRNKIENHPATKLLNESKRVTLNFGEGVAPFNFAIDKPELISRVLTDDGTAWQKLTHTPQGEPDVVKQQLLTLVAVNPQKVFQDIFNYGMQMGERKRVAEGQNAQRQQAVIAPISGNDKGSYRTGTYGGNK